MTLENSGSGSFEEDEMRNIPDDFLHDEDTDLWICLLSIELFMWLLFVKIGLFSFFRSILLLLDLYNIRNIRKYKKLYYHFYYMFLYLFMIFLYQIKLNYIYNVMQNIIVILG